MGVRVPITVEMDDGRELKTVIDQRDYAAVEAEDINPATQRNLWVRYLAYNALRRAGKYDGTWEKFNARDCVEAIDDVEEPAGDDEGLDPGRTGPGAGS